MSSPNAVVALTLPDIGGRAHGASRSPAADGPLPLPEFTAGGAPALPRDAADAAYERGLVDGRREVDARVDRRARSALDALTAAAAQIDTAAAAFEQDRERNLTALALAVAHRLVDRFVASEPAVVAALVARALELMPTERSLEIRLHPADLAVVRPALEEMSARPGAPSLQLRADTSLALGDFVIDGPQRLVDGRTDTALRTLYDGLASA